MNRIFRNTIFYLLIFLVIVGIVNALSSDQTDTEIVSFSTFTERLEQGEVRELVVKPLRQVYHVRGQFTDQAEGDYFETHVFHSEQAAALLAEAEALVDVQPADEASGWVRFFKGIFLFIIFFI